jgi:hypothetical protein
MGVEQTSVHGVGSVWATMWDLTWAYVNIWFDNNKYTGTAGNVKSCRCIERNQITTL